MSTARGREDQKQLAAYVRAQALREEDPGYPDDRTVSRWMSARGVPADALVIVQLKILAEGGSIDELMGQESPLRARIEELDGRVMALERVVAQMAVAADVGAAESDA